MNVKVQVYLPLSKSEACKVTKVIPRSLTIKLPESH